MDKRVLPFAAMQWIQRLPLRARRCGLLSTAIDSAVGLLG